MPGHEGITEKNVKWFLDASRMVLMVRGLGGRGKIAEEAAREEKASLRWEW